MEISGDNAPPTDDEILQLIDELRDPIHDMLIRDGAARRWPEMTHWTRMTESEYVAWNGSLDSSVGRPPSKDLEETAEANGQEGIENVKWSYVIECPVPESVTEGALATISSEAKYETDSIIDELKERCLSMVPPSGISAVFSLHQECIKIRQFLDEFDYDSNGLKFRAFENINELFDPEKDRWIGKDRDKAFKAFGDADTMAANHVAIIKALTEAIACEGALQAIYRCGVYDLLTETHEAIEDAMKKATLGVRKIQSSTIINTFGNVVGLASLISPGVPLAIQAASYSMSVLGQMWQFEIDLTTVSGLSREEYDKIRSQLTGGIEELKSMMRDQRKNIKDNMDIEVSEYFRKASAGDLTPGDGF
ncbi:hypothetical protein [Salininema proteolyticum]|uniref:Uncharacterized protein n=1 Tax=Salininema proteolyticum TaxID=1607685 RepID=A0ABV8TW37_9ACTN